MRQETLCLIIQGERLLLGYKKRGFAMGKWNGFGGKVNPEETLEAAALREVEEEVGLTIHPHDLKAVGVLTFYFTNHPGWNRDVHLFLAEAWQGEPRESEEMRPEWFPIDQLPFQSMWSDDPLWLPLVLAGKKIKGEFHFSDDQGRIEKHLINESAT